MQYLNKDRKPKDWDWLWLYNMFCYAIRFEHTENELENGIIYHEELTRRLEAGDTARAEVGRLRGLLGETLEEIRDNHKACGVPIDLARRIIAALESDGDQDGAAKESE